MRDLDKFAADFGRSLDAYAAEHGLAPAPAKRSIENPNTPIDADTLDLWGAGPPTKASVRVTAANALQQAVVWACVRTLGETQASFPWHVYRRTKSGKEIAREHPLYPVLHTGPNPLMTSFTYREVLMAHAALWGKHYALISRRTEDIALIIIPPWMVRQDWSKGSLRYVVEGAGENAEFTPDEMIHIPGLSFDGVSSLAPVMMAAREAIGLALAAEEHSARFFSNGARVGGILSTDGSLSPEAKARIKTSWAEVQQGLANAYKTAVLEGGLKYQPIGMQSDHAQLLETRKFQVIEICRVFRVPPVFVQDLSHGTFSNTEQQDLFFAKHTMAPWCARIEQEFNRKLFAGDPDHFCEFSMDGLMRGDFRTRTEGYARALGGPGAQGYMTVNEVRALENLPPIEGGDVLVKAGTEPPAAAGGATPPPKKDE